MNYQDCNHIGPEQNYAVKGRSIQDNLHLVREILEGLEDDTEATLINLDQSKAFDRMDHRFLATILETTRFKPEFRKWIRMMYHNPQVVVQVNRKRSSSRSDRVAPYLLFSMSLLWSPCSIGLGMRKLVRPCKESPLPAVLGQRSLRTPMISLSLCHVDWTYWL